MHTLLQRRLIGQTATRQLQALLAAHLPVLEQPTSAASWRRRAKRVRQPMLALFFRGHADGLLDVARRKVRKVELAAERGHVDHQRRLQNAV